MRVSPISMAQYNNSKRQQVAFHGFFRNLKNAVGGAIDAGRNVLMGETDDYLGEWVDQMSIRETGFRVGEKENIERQIAAREKQIEDEKEFARQATKKLNEVTSDDPLDSLVCEKMKILKDEFFSVVAMSHKDSSIIPPNGILIEEPVLFEFKNPIEVYGLYDVENQGIKVLLRNMHNYISLYKQNLKERMEYDLQNMLFEHRKSAEQSVLSYLNCNENINTFVESPKSVADFQAILKKSKDAFSNNGKHSLIILENFENIGTSKTENRQIIAALKSITCSCAEKFHSTFLIKIAVDKIKDIDPVLLVDSRMPIRIKF